MVIRAVFPLMVTKLLPFKTSKLVPVISSEEPTNPVVGANDVIFGGGKSTVKLAALVMVCPPTATDIAPEIAPLGTVAVILVVVLEVTVAVTPLNLTILLAGVELKLVPVIVMDAPTEPKVGAKEEIVGGAPQFMVAVQPERVTIPSEVNKKVNSPPGADEVILLGKVDPVNCAKSGDAVEGPLYTFKKSYPCSKSKDEKETVTFSVGLTGEKVWV